MRIVSIGDKVQDGDYSRWRVVLEHDGKEIADWFYYGGAIEAVDRSPDYPELGSKAVKFVLSALREIEFRKSGDLDKLKIVRAVPEVLPLADEIVNKVLQDKGKL